MKTKPVLFATFGVIAMSLFPTGSIKRSPVNPKVPTQNEIANRTTALRIVSTVTEPVGGQTLLKIRVENISNKPIVEYAFVRSDGSSLSTSGATTGWELAPQDQDIVSMSLPLGISEPVVLTALLFDDGTGQGSLDEVAYMRNYRAGVDKQYRAALPLLHHILDSSKEANARDLLQNKLLPELSSLPEGAARPAAKGVSAGMNAAKQFMLGQLASSRKKLDTTGELDLDALKSDLDRVTNLVEKAVAKITKQSTHAKG